MPTPPCHLLLTGLALIVVSSNSAFAAVTAVSIATPVVTDAIAANSNTVNLSTNSLDWIVFKGGTTTDEKSGATQLSRTTQGSIVQGSFTPSAPTASFKFNWSDGTTTTAASNWATMTNFTSTNAGAGWQIQATNLAAGTYQMSIYAARTDDAPISFELYDNATFITRQTVNGDTVNDGNTVDNVTGVLTFTVGGPSDIVNARFIRDAINGSLGTTAAADATLAIGGVTLTAVPEPSVALLGGLGALALLRRRRNG